jgi:hypothetical protein
MVVIAAVNNVRMNHGSVTSNYCTELSEEARRIALYSGGLSGYENRILRRAMRAFNCFQAFINYPVVTLLNLFINEELTVATHTA